MESNLSCLSSLKDDNNPLYIQPHYKESYRLAIYALLCGGKEAYEEFLRAEQIGHFLSEEEILYVFQNAELPVTDDSAEGKQVEDRAGHSTYFPTESDEEVPDLDLGWPEVSLGSEDTSISLLFNPPRQNTPTIKEVVRKQIQGARQVIAIAMDVFTDLDIFKETVTAALRGVMVYILLDDSQFKSFLTMSQRVGINVQDLRNIRVRTVRGQRYQCQSGVKFRGDLEQRFLLVDCRTVLYGTYSYTWSYEKINVSMVLVITGQLVGSYDEEFRRLYARSTVPTILSREKSSVQYLRDIVALQSPNSSHLSLHQLQTQTKVTHGTWGAQADRFSNAAAMTRGLSVQEKLHQSHCFDMGNLMRGHSYGGELQKLSPMTRLRMGTKDIGVPINSGQTRPNPRGDLLPPNRSSQHHLRHQNRYGADQSLIPFNSETSLNRWKMDTYFNDSSAPLDASCDIVSSIMPPYGSHLGLNEHQTQLIHNRSRDIKSRLEEARQKRLSQQNSTNLRHSQESLMSVFQEKTKYKRDLDKKKIVEDSEPNAQKGNGTDPVDHKDSERKKVPDKKEPTLPKGQRSPSHCDGAVAPDRKTTQAYDCHEPPSRADSDDTQNDPMLKDSHPQHPRLIKSLSEIPEEKGEGSSVKGSDSPVLKEGHEEVCKDEKVVPKEKSVESSIPAESQLKDPGGGGLDSVGKAGKSSGPAPRDRKKSSSNEVQTVPEILNPSAESQPTVADKSGQVEKKKVPGQEPLLQRKPSLRMKVSSMLSQDEKKVHKKEEKSLQRKSSVRSHAAEQPAERGQSPSLSRSQSSLGGPAEAERQRSPFPRLTPQRSSSQASKRKPNPSRGTQRGSRSTPGGEAADDPGKQKVYSRFEYLLSSDGQPAQSDGRTFPNRQESTHQSGADNKLGRFMQRVGNLIGKNK
ncbi:uncharacterized protein AB9W97_015334 [Spinachia spinachia]